MIEAHGVPQRSRILDVGCGPGELVSSLLNKDYDVWGVDISQGMVETARKVLEANGFLSTNRIFVCDIENLSFKDSFFDVVVAAGVMEYQKREDESLSEMRRVLKLGGYLVLNVTIRYSYMNVLDNLYRQFRKQRIPKATLNFIKDRVLRKGQLGDILDRRTHSPWEFDKLLNTRGFNKICHRFFHFSPLPNPFASVFSGIYEPIGKLMEKRLATNRIAPLLAGGYLVMAKKET
jgi:ubiquinone/menaquinone biosynthesis C-methylase UbiE